LDSKHVEIVQIQNETKMKTKLKYILIGLALVAQFSCNRWMDLLPPSGLTREEFWQTKEDVESVVMAAYRASAQLHDRMFIYGEARADLITYHWQTDGDLRMVMEGNITEGNSLNNWDGFYKVINYCNEVIAIAEDVQKIDLTFTNYKRQTLVAEAIFLRSLAYFYLVRTFKDVPYITTPSLSDNSNFYPKKMNGDSIMAFLIQDLNEQRGYLSGGYATIAETKGRASTAAANALLADMCLWVFDYQKAIQYVEAIEATDKFELMPSADWFEIFYPGNSLESIFEFQFDQSLEQSSSLAGMTNSRSNNLRPSARAIEMFSREYENGEFSRGEDISIRRMGLGTYFIWKYWGAAPDGMTTRTSTEDASANFIVYRYADVLLMKAEALSQLGRYNEALTIVNEIRDRSKLAPVNPVATPNAFEDVIMEERALELAFEGKRWFDLLRMGRRNNFARKDQLISVAISSVPSSQKRILATKLTNPNGWYLPIFKGEMERNKNLVQNPYYTF
jgi:starch-binding outer membrane protein, SusD/RagB family